MKPILFILASVTSGTLYSQSVLGDKRRYVPEKPILDSTINAATLLAEDEILLALNLDSLCRIRAVSIARDIDDGCGVQAIQWGETMELEVMRYYKFNCPPQVLMRCRCVFGD